MTDASPRGYLYILRSVKSGRYYLGSTIDPGGRLVHHNAGRTRATRGKGPWRFAAILEFPVPAQARAAEQWLKRIHRRETIEQVVAGDFVWPDGFGVPVYVDPNWSGG